MSRLPVVLPARGPRLLALTGGLCGALLACAGVGTPTPEPEAATAVGEPAPAAPAPAGLEEEGAVGGAPRSAKMATGRSDEFANLSGGGAPPAPPAEADGAELPAAAGDKGEGSAPTRAWFPETFLWQPRLRTDASGSATVQVRMPDRLTGWRVLGLAHTADGAQAGALARVETRLPAWVELVPPPFLRVGDRVELPLLAVNATPETLRGTLSLELDAPGGRARQDSSLVLLPTAQVQRLEPFTASSIGPLALRARLQAGGVDDAEQHTVEVIPVGRPLVEQRKGTLGAPAALQFDPPPSPTPAATRLRLTVAPGALAVVRAEIEAGRVPAGLAGAAWALQLSATAPALLTQLGAPPAATGPDRALLDDRLRRQRMRATQRVALLPTDASIQDLAALVRPALLHAQDPTLAAIALRAADRLAAAQAPDGTLLASADGAAQSVDDSLLQLSDVVRALDGAAAAPGLAPRVQAEIAGVAQRVRVLAEGAAQRLAPDVRSAETQAALLAAGLLQGPAATAAREAVQAAVQPGPDGFAQLHTGDRPRRSTVAATALGALALHRAGAAAEAQRLGDGLLAAWVPGAAWGSAQDDLLALEAIALLYAGGLPSSVHLKLQRADVVLWQQTLDAAELGAVQIFDLHQPDFSGPLTLVADPPLPGAAWSASLRTMVPWTMAQSGGLSLALSLPPRLRAGAEAIARIELAAPARTPVRLLWGLPAGVGVDERALQELVTQGQLRRFRVADGELTLELPARAETFTTLSVPLWPAFAGALQSGAIEAEVGDTRFVVATPSTWTIAPR